MAADPYITTYSQTYSDFGLSQSKLWPSNTLCITIAGANTARSAILKFAACFPDSIVGFIPDDDKASLVFIKYSLDLMRERFLAVTRGATQDNLSLDKLLSFPIKVPPAPEQRRIASILSTYDALIENNMRRIAVLEEMARCIYEEWFVHFRFPDHENVGMVECELGQLPKGWSTQSLGDLVTFQKGRKPVKVFHEPAEGLIHMLLIDALRGGALEYASPEKLITVAESDTIMVMDGSGSCEVFVGHEGAIGSTLGRYRVANNGGIGAYWLHLLFLTRKDEIRAKNTGAAIPHANKDYINSIRIAKPAFHIAKQFEEAVSPMYWLGKALRLMNANLRTTRDLLLPRLISGELDVSSLPEPEAAVA